MTEGIRRTPKLLWKLLSYLMDVPLEHISSECNPTISLYLSNGEFKLVSQTAIYSYGLKYEHFLDAFNKIEIRKRKPTHILILGLGTGSIPQMLEAKFKIEANYDFVERDPEVIFLFEKYQDYIYKGPFKTYCEDGLDYMAKNQKYYDLICMDIFDDNLIPKKFESAAFLNLLKKSLSANGILLYNRLNVVEEDYQKNKLFLNSFKEVFPESNILKHDYNWILVAENTTDAI